MKIPFEGDSTLHETIKYALKSGISPQNTRHFLVFFQVMFDAGTNQPLLLLTKTARKNNMQNVSRRYTAYFFQHVLQDIDQDQQATAHANNLSATGSKNLPKADVTCNKQEQVVNGSTCYLWIARTHLPLPCLTSDFNICAQYLQSWELTYPLPKVF